MFRFPKYFIFLFVGLSIVTAYTIQRFQNSHQFQMTEFSSQAFKMFDVVPGDKAANCRCLKNENQNADQVQTEDDSCSEERNYLKSLLEDSPSIFREDRIRNLSDFPRECVIYAMKKWRPDSAKKSSIAFRSCKGKALKPCVSRIYVNVVYNYFTDVTDCLGLSQRSLVPKLFLESGFHLNSVSRPDSAGIDQIPEPMLLSIRDEFDQELEKLKSSGKESCNRVSSVLEHLKARERIEPKTCTYFQNLEEPAVNLFYMGLAEKQLQAKIAYFLESPESPYKIFESLAKLGLKTGSYEPERLKEILQVLGADVGPEASVLLLSNYLKYYPSISPRRLKASDLSFGKNNDHVPTFFDYVRDYQYSGKNSYLDKINETAKELNSRFKEGTCVPESFLSL